MRPASLISLIIAAVLILVGIITCAFASGIAKSENIMLFPETVDGESVYRFDFTGLGISKLSLNAGEAKITVTHGGDTSYIEITNYNANYYKFSSDNKIISFTEVTDFMSMFKFWDGGFSFKGMRYLFRSGDDGGEKSITVNIAESESLKNFSVSADGGSIDISGFSSASDFVISPGAGSLSFTSVTGDASVSLNCEDASVSLSGCELSYLEISGEKTECDISAIATKKCLWNVKDGSIEADAFACEDFNFSTDNCQLTITRFEAGNITASSKTSAISLDIKGGLSPYSVELSSQSGPVFAGDIHYTGSYSAPASAARATIKVTSESGTVSAK